MYQRIQHQLILILIFCFCSFNGFTWTATSHKIVAQIAYDHLSPEAKKMCHTYLRSPTYNSPNLSFVGSANWMDAIKAKSMHRYDAMHYIDIPFSTDGSNLPLIQSRNAVWAIKNATRVFASNQATYAQKQFTLRLLIHIIADLHQPLHAATRVSAQLPKGDLGGNLFPLGKNPVGRNLHQYWDNGAGLFLRRFNAQQIKQTAHQLEKKWPCSYVNTQENPEEWSKISHELALNNAYQLNPYDIPSSKYQAKAQTLIPMQLTSAGCRLAALLNQLAIRNS